MGQWTTKCFFTLQHLPSCVQHDQRSRRVSRALHKALFARALVRGKLFLRPRVCVIHVTSLPITHEDSGLCPCVQQYARCKRGNSSKLAIARAHHWATYLRFALSVKRSQTSSLECVVLLESFSRRCSERAKRARAQSVLQRDGTSSR